jgi:hypothetical protein
MSGCVSGEGQTIFVSPAGYIKHITYEIGEIACEDLQRIISLNILDIMKLTVKTLLILLLYVHGLSL